MSIEQPKPDQAKKSGKGRSTIVLVGLTLVAFAALFVGLLMNPDRHPQIEPATPAPVTDSAPVEETTLPSEPAAVPSVAGVTFDLDAARKERILGNPTAPIKVVEHASLTCGHCGRFHKESFKAFKAAYIDTGKAYLVFSDFPLNAPAMYATKISRCVPEDKYFDFIDVLFDKQDEWAYSATYLDFLKKAAANHGLSPEMTEACLNSKDLENALVARMEAVQKQWAIQSTPSFVINNQAVLSGAANFEQFDKDIQNAVTQIENGTLPPIEMVPHALPEAVAPPGGVSAPPAATNPAP